MPGSLKDRIQHDLNDALRARDELRKTTLRMLTAAVRNAEIPGEGQSAQDRQPLDDDGVLAIIRRQVKQRRESIELYRRGAREDLAGKEEAELGVLLDYLPAEATEAEIEAAVREVLAATGVTSAREIGKVMPVLVQRFEGRTDGRAINAVVRRLLGP